MPKSVLLFILGSSLFFSCKVTQSTELKISGGDLAPADVHPAVFKLFSAKGENPLHPFCTGTATTDRHLLTAAHCLSGITEDQQILIITDQPHFASKAIIPKSYFANKDNLSNKSSPIPDFGFLEFEEGTFSDAMKIATSAPNTSHAEAVGMGCNLFFKTFLDDVPKSINQKLLKFKWTASFALNQLGPDGSRDGFWQFTSKDRTRLPLQVCPGDSGGPLIANGEIIGVHSYLSYNRYNDAQRQSSITDITHRFHTQMIRRFFQGDRESFTFGSLQVPQEQSAQFRKDLADVLRARRYVEANFARIKSQIQRSYDIYYQQKDQINQADQKSTTVLHEVFRYMGETYQGKLIGPVVNQYQSNVPSDLVKIIERELNRNEEVPGWIYEIDEGKGMHIVLDKEQFKIAQFELPPGFNDVEYYFPLDEEHLWANNSLSNQNMQIAQLEGEPHQWARQIAQKVFEEFSITHYLQPILELGVDDQGQIQGSLRILEYQNGQIQKDFRKKIDKLDPKQFL